MENKNQTIKEFLNWLKTEKESSINAANDLGINSEIIAQQYDKIITKYKGTVYGENLCNQFKANQN